MSHLLSGDTRRFGFVYDYFAEDLLGIIFKIVKDEKIAEDILQDSFINIWNAASSYDPLKSRPFTWMLNIARNSAIDYTRSKQSKIKKVTTQQNAYALAHEPVFTNETSEASILTLVHNLKKDQLDVITLGFLKDTHRRR